MVLSGDSTFILYSIRTLIIYYTAYFMPLFLHYSQGVVENLQKPVVALARLRDSVVMEGVLEATIPVRFVFFLMGPSHSGMDYHETGRAMASLMADWVTRSYGLALKCY